MAKKTEAEDLVGQVLDSQDLRQALASALSKGTTSSTTATVDEELGRLFHRRSSQNLNTTPPLPEPTPRYLLRNHFGNMKQQKTSNRVKTHGGAHPYFHKDVILLCWPGDKNVIKQGEKEALYQRGHVLSAFQFCKNWDSYTVLEKLREAFGPKVPVDVRLQILMGCGNKLVVPALSDCQDLTGLMVHKVFNQKAIYLRPSRDLYNVEFDSSTERQTVTSLFANLQQGVAQDSCQDSVKNRRSEEITVTSGQSSSNLSSTAQNEYWYSWTLPQANSEVCTLPPSTSNANVMSDCIQSSIPIGSCNNSDFTQCSLDNNLTADPIQITDSNKSNNEGQINQSTTVDDLSPICTNVYTSESYRNYVECIDLDDISDASDDIDLAIQASLEDHFRPAVKEVKSAQELLSNLATQSNSLKTSKFNINRNNVWDGALRGFRRKTFNPTSRITVKFSDDSGVSEEAVDLAVREDWYYEAGQMIAVSMIHGGPSPAFFSNTLFKCLIYGPEFTDPSMDDVADFDILGKIKKVKASSTLQELQIAMNEGIDYLAVAGCLRTVKSVEDKELLIKDLLTFHVINRVRGPFERFREGLKHLGFLSTIQENPDVFLPLLCHKPEKLSEDKMDGLFTIIFSPEGSNQKTLENMVVSFWRDYLQDVEDGQATTTLTDILIFATGSDCVPPIGFMPHPTIEFLHSDLEQFTPGQFPKANTCINLLKLPIINNYEKFKEKMDFAFCNTQGFGRK